MPYLKLNRINSKAMLQTQQILLRAVEPEDLKFLYRCENDTDLWQYSSTTEPYSQHTLKRFISDAQNDIYTNRQQRFMIVARQPKAHTVGCIDLFNFDPYHRRAEVGIVIRDEADRRQGFAAQSLTLLIEYAFNFLHLRNLSCIIQAENKASIGLFSKCGFEQCGTFSNWFCHGDWFTDAVVMQLVNKK